MKTEHHCLQIFKFRESYEPDDDKNVHVGFQKLKDGLTV